MMVHQRVLNGKVVEVELLLQFSEFCLRWVEEADPNELVSAAGKATALTELDLAHPAAVLICVSRDDLTHAQHH